MATILVIDDDITIQLTLKRILQKQGYEVEIASDGEAGLERAIALQPAAIVCDWMMPGMKGPEVCQRVRERPELSASFFILLTAFDSVEEIVRGLDAGADDFLTKPPDIAELKARIRTGCRSFELKRALQLKTQELDVGLRATADYVRSLLPSPFSGNNLSFNWEWLPSARLGGNGIFCRWLNDDAFVFGLLDVVQTGIGSALQAAQLMTTLQSEPIQGTDFSPPEQVLATLAKQLRESTNGCNQAAFSIWYGVYCPSQQTVTYASAGDITAVLVNSRDRVTQLASQQPEIGHLSAEQPSSGEAIGTGFIQDSHPLKSGNTLYLLSNGLTKIEQSLESWEEGKYVQLLADTHAQNNRDDMLSTVVENVRRKLGLEFFEEDVSLVRVRVS